MTQSESRKRSGITQPHGYFWQAVSVFVDPHVTTKEQREVNRAEGFCGVYIGLTNTRSRNVK